MSPEVSAAFRLGAGFGAGALYTLIAALLSSALFGWAVWALVGHYRHWAEGAAAADWLLGAVLAVLVLLLILVHYL